jgi:uncharacterized protein (TIGR00369 family)
MSEDGYSEAADDQGFHRAVPLHAWMGLRIQQKEPSTVLAMDLGENVRGPRKGTIHGGMLMTLADVTAALAVEVSGGFDPTKELPVTTDMHIRFYRQPKSGPLTAEGRVVYRGRRLLSAECSVTDADHRELVRATATYMVVPLPQT